MSIWLANHSGVKWELKFAWFFTGKMGFGSLGLGIRNKIWEMRLRFKQNMALYNAVSNKQGDLLF